MSKFFTQGLHQYTIVIAAIVRRLLSSHLLQEDNSLNACLIDLVLFMGDHHQRMYRYLDQVKVGPLGSFLFPAFQE